MITLTGGKHTTRQDGMCLLEAVAFVANEPHTDAPECVCPMIASFGRTINDGMPDTIRTAYLSPLIEQMIGTRGSVHLLERRAFTIADWAVRTVVPMVLDAVGTTEHAKMLRDLLPVTDVRSAYTAGDAVYAAYTRATVARTDADAAAYAAYNAIYVANANANVDAVNVTYYATKAAACAAKAAVCAAKADATPVWLECVSIITKLCEMRDE